jgi:hypothetical protein
MAAELPQGKELLLPASAAQENHLKVYRRCPQRHVRVSSSTIISLFIFGDPDVGLLFDYDKPSCIVYICSLGFWNLS